MAVGGMVMESDSGESVFGSHATPIAMSINVLDNPVWHALVGPHREHALGRGAARHYPRDIAPFSAVAEPTAQAYCDLSADLAPGTEARLFRPRMEPLPDGWHEVGYFPMLQMLAETTDARLDGSLSPLSVADAPDMLDLVAACKPGPFEARTPLLGRYAGIWQDDRLIAMAGERMRLPGYVELSAICVRPEMRGKGYAAALTGHLMRLALDRGEIPFLHVRPDNAPAIALYKRLGFVTVRELVVLWRRPG
jgi:ribosomal protein S18 acetylase RimI-like enzyme